MKKRNKVLRMFALCFSIILCITFIGNAQITNAATTTTLKLNQSKVTLCMGKTTTLKYCGPAVRSVKWKSSDKKVATINANGTITPIKNGSCTITLTAKDALSGKKLKATCKVKIPKPDLYFSTTDKQLKIGDTQVVSVYTSNTNSKVAWSSSNNGIVNIAKKKTNTKQATITAKSSGTAVITASVNGKTATMNVTVLQTGLSLSGTVIGADGTYYASVAPNSTISVRSVVINSNKKVATWKIDDASIGKLSSTTDSGSGIKITGLKQGSTIIHVTAANGNSVTLNLTVTSSNVQGITINGKDIKGTGRYNTDVGKATNITVGWKPLDSHCTVNAYIMSGGQYATVYPIGNNVFTIQGLANGNATIKITVQDENGSILTATLAISVAETW